MIIKKNTNQIKTVRIIKKEEEEQKTFLKNFLPGSLAAWS